jgi:hypothetical protein
MADRRVRVALVLDDRFSAGIERARAAAAALTHRLALLEATWEPIDWSEF